MPCHLRAVLLAVMVAAFVVSTTAAAVATNGTVFLYGSYLTITFNATVPSYSAAAIQSTLFSRAFLANSAVNVTLNTSTVVSLTPYTVRVVLGSSEFASLAAQLVATRAPYTPLTLQFGSPPAYLALGSYCLLHCECILNHGHTVLQIQTPLHVMSSAATSRAPPLT